MNPILIKKLQDFFQKNPITENLRQLKNYCLWNKLCN